ncbi:MAG: Pimeloyl-ACP methyl ester carboxylesterase [Hydrocarboniphaga sp.]|uniref:alpha/beta fold hydrolase n=1 Tax=Hydrocarboniphaga sp. TaxID=2033016 RepID=UPI002618B28F|nr:alpha/beta hydrolase [Hydrocarboniphaga sp.]MDB5972360.1 Pimeloyl-ACP methyl ester carboxylesterase [Hydrocarboniphaga sp.]
MTDYYSAEPERLTIAANGIDFVCLALGEGPLVLCLHGFPDRAENFVPLLRDLAAAGFRGVAPYLRGYAPTSMPDDGDYTITALAMDVIALIDHLGAERAALVGHDWGAAAAYAAANLRPDRISRIVCASVPHLRRFILRPTFAQIRRSSYILAFQFAGIAERRLMKDDFAQLEKAVATAAPGLAFSNAEWWISLKAAFAEPGRLTAALSYYRGLRKLFGDAELWRLATAPVAVPARLIYGARDGAIGAEMFSRQEHLFTAGLDIQRMETGHFMQIEQPAAFAQLVIDFLQA